MKATTRNFFRVINTMIGDWVEFLAPLLGERLLQYVRAKQNNQQFATINDDHMFHLSSRVTFITRS